MVTALICSALLALPQGGSGTAEHYEIVDLPQPDNVVLEVGGILARGQELLVSTRRGEVWRIEDAYSQDPSYSLWTEGLHEPLGLLAVEDWVYTAQRGELSRLQDSDGDGRADLLETICEEWPLSGNYHEYCFGPARTPDGSFWLTLNKPFGPEPFGRVDWRGWAVRVTPDGRFEPVCAGLRSPAGIEVSPWGEPFYSDNQGEWCATGKFAPLHVGDFHGHPHGIASCNRPESLVEHPGEVPNGVLISEAAEQVKNYRLPAVWIPYDRVGRSPSGFVWDTEGNFGPYRDQVFMADQYSSEVFRLSLEKVDGRWQGACYPFVKGLKCGITRVAWGTDGSLWCGMTERGWPSLGDATDGLQRIRWTGETAFELLEMKATAGGFELRFTKPLSAASVKLDRFEMSSWTYLHHSTYGSKETDTRELRVTSAELTSPDTVTITVEGLVDTRVHHLHLEGLTSENGEALWHQDAYYTRNATPE